MSRNQKILLLGGGFLAVLTLVVLLIVACRTPAAVQPTGNDVEVEDCDAEDRAKGEWWECGHVAPTKKPVAVKPTMKQPTTIRRNK